MLVITHGGLIRAIERELEIDSPHLANLGGLWVEVIGDEVAVRDRVELIDHTAVLRRCPRVSEPSGKLDGELLQLPASTAERDPGAHDSDRRPPGTRRGGT